MQDLIEGMCTLLPDQATITEWAQFILAASDLINLEALDDESILECLWDLSIGRTNRVADLLRAQG